VITGMSSSRFTKLDGSPEEAFFEQAVINLLKVAEGEGGGGGSPLSWLAMDGRTLVQPSSAPKPYSRFLNFGNGKKLNNL